MTPSDITHGVASGRDGSMCWSIAPTSFHDGSRYAWDVSVLNGFVERIVACGSADNQDIAKASVFAVLRLMGVPNGDTKKDN